MKARFTAQDVINMGARLRDEFNFDRWQIKACLQTLYENGYTEAFDFDRVFDLIIGQGANKPPPSTTNRRGTDETQKVETVKGGTSK